MVSHHYTGTTFKLRDPRAPRRGAVTEMDGAIPHHRPVPNPHPHPVSNPHPHPHPDASPARSIPTQRPLGDSMVAYTERMREISKFRHEAALQQEPDPPPPALEVQARHIPKASNLPSPRRAPPRYQNRPARPRRPLSLDELVGRPGKGDGAAPSQGGDQRRERRFSEPCIVPSMEPPIPGPSSKETKEGGDNSRIRISFVSAADLFELVDFSLRSKRSREDSLRLARAEDALRIIQQAGVFRSGLARGKVKAAGEKGKGVDRASLFVHGISSPREEEEGGMEGGGGGGGGWVEGGEDGRWARMEVRRNRDDSYDSDDEGENDDDVVDSQSPAGPAVDEAVARQRRLLMLHPHRLRQRPRRAKRMKLHRPPLSAIPEDDRLRHGSHRGQGGHGVHGGHGVQGAHGGHGGQGSHGGHGDHGGHRGHGGQEGHRGQEGHEGQEAKDHRDLDRRLPVLPSASSLVAIQTSRKHAEVSCGGSSTRRSSLAPGAYGRAANPGSGLTAAPGPGPRPHRPPPGGEPGKSPLPPDPTARKPDPALHSALSPPRPSVARPAPAHQTSLNVHDTTPARSRAQRKFKKLIFLRDQPEPSNHRHS